MPFESFARESDLCSTLEGHLSATLPGKTARRRSEFRRRELHVGAVIPDVLVTYGHRRSVDQSIKSARFTGFDSAVVAELLRAGSLHSSTISARLWSRPQTTEGSLRKLTAVGITRRTRGGAYRLMAGVIQRSAQVVAIEAKLVRWREAIEQAAAYRGFANRVYVALPAPLVNRAVAVRKQCRRSGVGLLSVSKSRMDVVVPAPVRRPQTAEWVWVLAQTLGLRRRTVRDHRSATVRAKACRQLR